MIRRLTSACVGLIFTLATAQAERLPTRAEILLWEAATPLELRLRLCAFADSSG